MQLQHNISLLPYNTFGMDVRAANFATINNVDELQEAVSLPYKLHIIGGGSNILLTKPMTGLVLHNALKGIAVLREDEEHVWLEVQSGEEWHSLVMYTINKGWGGIGNLALIPGTVGAAPIQNIGAYGVEARETIEQVRFWHLNEKTIATYTNAECAFGYRDSIFKNALKEQVFITSVVFRLNKKPVFNTSYGAIEQELAQMGAQELNVKNIAQAVINIRSSKLPDPKVIGNAGSFFKNPTISKAQYAIIQEKYPSAPSFPVSEQAVKVPAAWLIEQCGWKGFRNGDAGVHSKQALVLVNYGGASGDEIWKLSGDIVGTVQDKFGVELEREVQVW